MGKGEWGRGGGVGQDPTHKTTLVPCLTSYLLCTDPLAGVDAQITAKLSQDFSCSAAVPVTSPSPHPPLSVLSVYPTISLTLTILLSGAACVAVIFHRGEPAAAVNTPAPRSADPE